ncbi:MAG: fatty acid--CoA ligase [Archaeoglobaceae archaeon]|nr:fatty acid--CoA ligase [Archaeoglobaceae archaeon]MDW8128255.1 fatty acid--CoA ligase [Archaeoglobaceae archaeon]
MGLNYEYMLIIKHILETGVNYAPNQEIVYRDLRRYTYSELYERVCRLANALEDLGVKKGTRVGVLEWDSNRYLECYFAIPMLGAVLHTVNIRLSPDDIRYTINHAEDELLLLNSDFLPVIESIKGELSSVKNFVIMTDQEMLENNLTDLEYENMLKKKSKKYEFPELDEKEMATLFYTSGTTGRPKGVWYSHRQLFLHTLASAVWLTGWRSSLRLKGDNEVYMPLTPMFHVHSWGYPYVATLLGLKQVYPGKYEPAKIIKLIQEERVSFSHCVPTVLQMVLDNLPPEARLDGWKVIVGGSKLPLKLAIRAKEKGITTITGYGMSETCPNVIYASLRPHMVNLPEEKKLEYAVKTGIPYPLVYARVVHEDFSNVKKDGKDMGEIVLRAPWLTNGYLKDEEKTKELWTGGWLHTGDLAVMDEEGYITVVDRLKDVIKSGGEWISSLTLENLISLHPKVKEVAVIGVPNEKWGERPMAVVVPTPGQDLTAEELKEHLMKFVEQGVINKWAIPDLYKFVTEIPKTSVGKLDKKVLRQKYRN